MTLAVILILGREAPAQLARGLTALGRMDTERFSIYYPARFEIQAERLAAKADSILAELSGLLGSTVPSRRIPVLISDLEIDLNGYFTPYPSNRIVILLAPAPPGSSLAGMDDELIQVFLHELVHFLTTNTRSAFWSALSFLAGDYLASSGWVSPYSLVEGTAVWAESRPGPSGRLNDPAALESVFREVALGEERGLWEVSGLEDQPGSGGLAYDYGALFIEYIVERYGSEAPKKLWSEMGKGNFIAGFEGSAGIPGAAERALGAEGRKLWADFLAWLKKRIPEPSDNGLEDTGALLDLDTGLFGPLALGSRELYYYDAERTAVFALDIASGARKRLFWADGNLESMRIGSDGSLELDWQRRKIGGEAMPVLYRYDFRKENLFFEGERPLPEAGYAKAVLEGELPPFFQAVSIPDASGYRYGLVRIGSQVLAARESRSGSLEVLDAPGWSFRSIEPDTSSAEPFLVLAAIRRDESFRLAFLRGDGDSMRLHVQKRAPRSSVYHPAIEAGKAVYMAAIGGGKRELRLLSVDEELLERDFDTWPAMWKPFEEARLAEVKREEGRLGTIGSDTAEVGVAEGNPGSLTAVRRRSSLFPRLLDSSRRPWADGEAVGIAADGIDLSERLSWTLAAGWDYIAARPEELFSLGLSAGAFRLGLALGDTSSGSGEGGFPTRSLSASASADVRLGLVPAYRKLGFSASAWAAGLDAEYEPGEFAAPDISAYSLGARFGISYSDARSWPYPPHDSTGAVLGLGADTEIQPGTGWMWSVFANTRFSSARARLGLRLGGALSLSPSLSFRASGRILSSDSGTSASAALPPYPVFREYSDSSLSSSYYLYAEGTATPLFIDIPGSARVLRIPFLPPLGLRWLKADAGFRIAALGSPEPSYPASAFVRIVSDFAVLLGVGGKAHAELMAELSYALSPSLAGGGALHFDWGLEIWY
ncbi:MAG TPA: hypothetical protein VIO60_04380 [Rectinemataceae bacterium]